MSDLRSRARSQLSMTGCDGMGGGGVRVEPPADGGGGHGMREGLGGTRAVARTEIKTIEMYAKAIFSSL